MNKKPKNLNFERRHCQSKFSYNYTDTEKQFSSIYEANNKLHYILHLVLATIITNYNTKCQQSH